MKKFQEIIEVSSDVRELVEAAREPIARVGGDLDDEYVKIFNDWIFQLLRDRTKFKFNLRDAMAINEAFEPVFQAQKRRQRETAKRGARNLVDKIALDLMHRDIRYQREVRIASGRLDFLIEEPLAIIEVKWANDHKTVRTAVGQLLFYKTQFAGARLYIATNEPIELPTKKIIKQYRISEWIIGQSPG